MLQIKAILSAALQFLLLILFQNASYSQEISDNHLLSKNRNKVLVAAHRGNWKNYPENSLEGITSCIGTGIDIVEVDVQITKDGKFVLMHDLTIDRTTNGKGKVSDYTLNELQNYKLKWKKDSLLTYRIPTLDTVIKATKGKIILNIDKSSGKFIELTKYIDSLDCNNHIILKGSGDAAYFKAMNQKDSNDLYYMPILSNKNKVDSFLYNYPTPLFEFILTNDTNSYCQLKWLDSISNKGIGIWYNALFNSISGGHTESTSAIQSWEWFVNHKAKVIQTDYPFHLIKYLNEKGLHEALNIEDNYNLDSLPKNDIHLEHNLPNKKPSKKNNSDRHKFYYVKQNDTLSGIAKQYQIKLSLLYQLNPILKKKKTLKKGQKIRVQ